MQTLTFSFLYLAVLLIPGWALQRWFLGPGERSSLLPLAMSFCLFCLSFLLFRNLGWSSSYFSLFVVAYCSVAATWLLAFVWQKTKLGGKFTPNNKTVGLLTVVLASCAYQITTDTYSELPADLYTHLERFQGALLNINDGQLGPPLPLAQTFLQGSSVYYYLAPLIAHHLGIPILELVPALDFLNRTIFLCVVYFFSLQVFAKNSHHVFIALACALFTALHMGTNVFAFVRYYSLAPVVINMAVFFATISIYLRLIEKRPLAENIRGHVVMLIFALTTSAVHIQETVFSLVMILAISLVTLASLRLFPEQRFSIEKRGTAHLSAPYLVLANVLILVGLIAAFAYSVSSEVRAPNAGGRLWEFTQATDLLPPIAIINLGYQFIQTVTLWGCFVYLLFFLHFRRYKQNWYIVAGMLSPFVTVLNPFFVDLFLRHNNATTLWRLCYLIPVCFVAADLFVHYAKRAFSWHRWLTLRSWLIISIMVLTLMPIENTWKGVHYSRFPTLFPSPNSDTLTNYADLLGYLQQLDQRYLVLTDPTTGYLVSGATKHWNERKKFFRTPSFRDFTFVSYEDSPLKRYEGYLLIVNQRHVANSRVGKLSNHWQENHWDLRKYYFTPTLLSHLANNPDRFQLLWSNNEVSVYEIKQTSNEAQ